MSSVTAQHTQSIDADKLIRWSGFTLILAGLLFGLFPFAHPNHDPEGFRGAAWIPAHLMPNVGAIVALLGLIGLFVRQFRAAGRLGFGGIHRISHRYGFVRFGIDDQAFIIPYMSLELPQPVDFEGPPLPASERHS